MAVHRDQGSDRYWCTGTVVPLPLQALVVAARRRRLVDDAGARRLTEAAQSAGVTQPADWLPLLGAGLPGIDCAALIRLLPKGDVVYGSYPLFAHLANGGMGAVWITAAADGLNPAVLKHTRMDTGKDTAAEDRMRRRFSREAGIHRRLHHPHVLRCLDVGISSAGQCYLVLEYVAGGDLADLVERCGALPEAVALALIHQVVDGLSEAHRLQLIHRDIKPGNVFLTSDGTAKLSDFGIARKEGEASSQLTLSGTVLGSPFYMSPEQVNAMADIDIRSDIYSIGGLLCFCLSARPPYPGKAMEAMRQHAAAPPPDLRRQGITLSDATAAIIARCMAKDRAQRYADPLELRAALAEARSGMEEADVGAWIRGESLAAVVDLNRTLGPDQEAGVDAAPAVPEPSSPLPAASAIRFREPEEIQALIAARESPRTRKAVATDVQAVRPPDAPIAVTAQARPLPPTASQLPRWLVLTAGADEERVIHLYGQESITLGKLAKPPVDLTALIYPIEANATACNRISRAHCVLGSGRSGFTVMDLGTGNGTTLAGTRLAANTPVPISGIAALVLAQELALTLMPVPARELAAPPAILPPSGGEALVITRTANRPSLSYALVRRSILIGGPGADLTIPGYPAGCGLLVVLTPEGWLQRLHVEGRDPVAWAPLAVGMVIGQGSQRITVRIGDHTLLTR